MGTRVGAEARAAQPKENGGDEEQHGHASHADERNDPGGEAAVGGGVHREVDGGAKVKGIEAHRHGAIAGARRLARRGKGSARIKQRRVDRGQTNVKGRLQPVEIESNGYALRQIHKVGKKGNRKEGVGGET